MINDIWIDQRCRLHPWCRYGQHGEGKWSISSPERHTRITSRVSHIVPAHVYHTRITTTWWSASTFTASWHKVFLMRIATPQQARLPKVKFVRYTKDPLGDTSSINLRIVSCRHYGAINSVVRIFLDGLESIFSGDDWFEKAFNVTTPWSVSCLVRTSGLPAMNNLCNRCFSTLWCISSRNQFPFPLSCMGGEDGDGACPSTEE